MASTEDRLNERIDDERKKEGRRLELREEAARLFRDLTPEEQAALGRKWGVREDRPTPASPEAIRQFVREMKESVRVIDRATRRRRRVA